MKITEVLNIDGLVWTKTCPSDLLQGWRARVTVNERADREIAKYARVAGQRVALWWPRGSDLVEIVADETAVPPAVAVGDEIEVLP